MAMANGGARASKPKIRRLPNNLSPLNRSEKQEGVIPDKIIKDHLLDKKDEILNGLLKRLD